jgi:hypothetical protein
MSLEAPPYEQAPASQISSGDALRSARRSHLTHAAKINVVVCSVIGLLCAVALDGGVSFQIWYFAMAAYWSAILLIWSVLQMVDGSDHSMPLNARDFAVH